MPNDVASVVKSPLQVNIQFRPERITTTEVWEKKPLEKNQERKLLKYESQQKTTTL